MTDVANISGGRVKLRARTLYAAPGRLAGEGLAGADRGPGMNAATGLEGRYRRLLAIYPAERPT
jgi:hypothetical protein